MGNEALFSQISDSLICTKDKQIRTYDDAICSEMDATRDGPTE